MDTRLSSTGPGGIQSTGTGTAALNGSKQTAGDSEDALEMPEERRGLSWRSLWIDWHLLWLFTGPGWLMSLAYLDPGNLEADLQMGSYSGTQLIWVLFWSTIMGLVLQMLAARLGATTGKNLAQMCREEYPRRTSLVLWAMTEIAIIGSDIQEIVGTAIAFQILFGFPLWLGALLTALDTFTFLGLHHFGIRKLEAFVCALIFTMTACFAINFTAAAPGVGELAIGTLRPSVPSYGVNIAMGTVGAVIMPHNIYLHSALVQSRKVDRTRPRMIAQANKYFAIESAVALFASFWINLFVVGTYAHTFFDRTCAEAPGGPYASLPLTSDGGFDGSICQVNATGSSGGSALCCGSIGLAQTQQALEGTLGSAAKYVWAIGLLAAGQASTMTGVFAGQFVMEGFLELKIAAWKRLALTRSIALVPALMVALATEANPQISDDADQWLNILQSVQLPFALLPVLHFTSDERLMKQAGVHFHNGVGTKLVCWALALFVIGLNIFTIVAYVSDPSSPTPYNDPFFVAVGLGGFMYLAFIANVARRDLHAFGQRLLRCFRDDGLGASEAETTPLLHDTESLMAENASLKARNLALEAEIARMRARNT